MTYASVHPRATWTAHRRARRPRSAVARRTTAVAPVRRPAARRQRRSAPSAQEPEVRGPALVAPARPAGRAVERDQGQGRQGRRHRHGRRRRRTRSSRTPWTRPEGKNCLPKGLKDDNGDKHRPRQGRTAPRTPSATARGWRASSPPARQGHRLRRPGPRGEDHPDPAERRGGHGTAATLADGHPARRRQGRHRHQHLPGHGERGASRIRR